MIGAGYLIALFGAVIAYVLSKGKSKKTKVPSVENCSYVANITGDCFCSRLTYAAIVKDPWVTFIMLYIFPIILIFILRLVMLLIGIFKKEEIAQP
ncbi:hypothetical protein [Sporosarcina ureae]|uniref:hypothetical protein n=1 Tax=Sporosarcina ureae TaxID=1571 RepID=UPI0028B198EB|nr:hypothetical protein [Sporosarcina ureae]